MKRMKRTIIAVVLVLCLAAASAVPALAEFDSTAARQCVVSITEGVEIEGAWLPFGSGSGFFVGNDANAPQYLLTNNHVVNEFVSFGSGEVQWMHYSQFVDILCEFLGYDTGNWDIRNQLTKIWRSYVGNNDNANVKAIIRIYYDNEDYEEGYLVERDSVKDVALLRLAGPTSKRSAVALSVPDGTTEGAYIHCVGFPGIADNDLADPVSQRSMNDVTFTPGGVDRVFTRSGSGTKTIQTSANMQHGHSGGPMILDSNNAAVGIDTWGISEAGEALNYAVSIEEAIPLLDRNHVTYVLKPLNGGEDEHTEETYTLVCRGADGVEEARFEETNSDGSAEFVLPGASERKGYTFQGWSDTQDGRASYAEGSRITVTTPGTKTLYAVWEKNPFPTWAIIAIAAAAVAVIAAVIILVVLRSRKKPQVPPVIPAGPVAPARKKGITAQDLRLQSVSGAFGSRRFEISNPMVIGRDPSSNLAYPANTPGVSGRHCQLMIENGTLYLQDLGSSYGTFFNGTKLRPQQKVALHEGDMIFLGQPSESFQIVLSSKASAARAAGTSV